MKTIFGLLVSVLCAFSTGVWANYATLKHAFENQQSNLQIRGYGTVFSLLPDDNHGSRHQKFILKLGNRQTLFISHNIDLAPRISDLNKGDFIEFYGEYEWNRKGGVIHWTHKDPRNKHAHGWLKHQGKKYE